jgi:type III secretory pathway component EscT
VPSVSLIEAVAGALARDGVDPLRLGLAWARVAPSVALVPGFGLRGAPAPARALFALILAACIFPAVAPADTDLAHASVLSAGALPMALLLLVETARGLPVAIAASVPLWAATMAGGVADALRGGLLDGSSPPPVEGLESPASPLSVALSLLATSFFLATGGPARVLEALALRAPPDHPLAAATQDLVGGITLAVAIGGPLLASAVVVEVAAAMVARAASPAQVHALIAPLRALGALAIAGVVFDRLAGVVARVIAHSP